MDQLKEETTETEGMPRIDKFKAINATNETLEQAAEKAKETIEQRATGTVPETTTPVTAPGDGQVPPPGDPVPPPGDPVPPPVVVTEEEDSSLFGRLGGDQNNGG